MKTGLDDYLLEHSVEELQSLPTIEVDKLSDNRRQEANNRTAPQVMSRFYPRPFTNRLLSEHEFLCEGERGYLWWYDSEKGIWLPNGGDFIRNYFRSTTDAIDDTLKKKHIIEEIIVDVQGLTLNIDGLPEAKINLIPFKNCVIDLGNNMSRDLRPDDYFTWTLPWNFNRNAKCPYLEKLINDILPPDEVITLWELMAYTLLRGYPYQKFFFLVGGGSNGKSTYVNILTRLLGLKNVSNVSLGDLQDSKFLAAELYRKLANISGEVEYKELKSTRLLKQLTGGDVINADRKYLKLIQFTNYAKLIFNTNQMPKTTDTTHAFYRRAFIIPFSKQFKPDPSIDMKIREESEEMTREYEGLALKAIQQLVELKKRKFSFSREQDIETVRSKYEDMSNPMVKFLEEHTDRTYDHEDYIYKYEFRDQLNDWLKSRGFNTYSETMIGKDMKELGFDDGKKDSPEGDKRYNSWVGIRWRNTQSEDSVQGVQDVKALHNNFLENIENSCNMPGQSGQVGQGSSSGQVESCDLFIPPRGKCRSSKWIVSDLVEGLQPFCKKYGKWCFHADAAIGEAKNE